MIATLECGNHAGLPASESFERAQHGVGSTESDHDATAALVDA